MLRKSDLQPLFCFDAVVRSGSLVGAASTLHVTHGAVSQQLKLLESRLGAKLFEREGRRLRLTAAGARLAESTQACFDRLETAFDELASPRTGPLVVSCEPTIAMKWLIPQLVSFYSMHPAIGVHLHTAGGPVHFKSHSIDVALRRNDFEWDESVIAERVCDEWVAPVCSPAMLARNSQISIENINLLHSARRPSAWQNWLKKNRDPSAVIRDQTFEHFHLSLQAAEVGLGMAIGSIFMISNDINTGRLIAPFGFQRDGSSYYLLRLKSATTQHDDQCKIFCDWLKECMMQTLQDMVPNDS